MKARMYIGVASNDDARQPDAKDKLRGGLRRREGAGGDRGLSSLHGWCVPDMPTEAGKPIYNTPDAERAWAKLVALYRTSLA